MIRFLCSAVAAFALISQAQADDQLAGIWRNTVEDLGLSFWELTPNTDGSYTATETGLGNRQGTARYKEGVLVLEFTADDHKGIYEWNLKGPIGEGNYTQTHTNGQVFKHKTLLRFIGK